MVLKKYLNISYADCPELKESSRTFIIEMDEKSEAGKAAAGSGPKYLIAHASGPLAYELTKIAGAKFKMILEGLQRGKGEGPQEIRKRLIPLVAEVVWLQEHGVQIERGGGLIPEVIGNVLLKRMGCGIKEGVDMWSSAIVHTKVEFMAEFYELIDCRS
jgi:hypothetical protein